MGKEAESGKEAEIPSSIPEIYFDIIARVVPGAIAIAAYKFDSLSHNLNTPTISFALLCSYFLGLLFHVLGDTLWLHLFYRWQPALGRRLRFFAVHPLLDVWAWIRHLPIAERAVYTKMAAERSMFQGVALLGLIWIFFPPPVVTRSYSHAAWHVTIPLFLACFYGMNVIHQWLSWNMDISPHRPPGSRHVTSS
jgi:hypothetical protein